MAKIIKRSLDSAKRAPVRQSSYEAPAIRRKKKKKGVPQEYRTFKKAPKSHGGLWLLFFIFLATVAGFFFWSQRNQPVVDNSLEFNVTGTNKIISGDQVTYLVEYKNLDVVPLQKMELDVRWPDGFYFDEATIEPHDQNATTWFLTDLMPNEKVSLEIKGQLVGNKDDKLSAVFTLGYQPENFHSDFSAKKTVETKIKDSKLELAIVGVDKTMVDVEQEIKIRFTNLTDQPLADLYIDILYPDDFEFAVDEEDEEEEDFYEEDEEEEDIDLDFIQEGNYLVLNLDTKATKEMLIKGSFGIDSKKEQKLVVEIGNMVEENFRRLARAEKDFMVINPQFGVDLQINGETGQQNVKWSDVLRYQLEVVNQSETDIEDVKITALVDSQVLDWDTLDTIGIYEESKITWTKDEDEELAIWPAGASKIFTWQVKVEDDPQTDRTIENIVKLNIEGLTDWEQVNPPVLLTVGESVTFNNGVYWDLGGRRVGSGLLPPQVGEQTQYLAVWSIPEANGDFDSIDIATTLPPEVEFIGETDIQEGELEFDPDTRSLVWVVDDFANVFLPITASFIIQLEPTEEFEEETMTLLNSTVLTAQGVEEVTIRTKMIKTSDVVADSSEPIGIIQ